MHRPNGGRFRCLRAALWILFAGLFPVLFFGNIAIKNLLGLSTGGFAELLLAYMAMDLRVTGYATRACFGLRAADAYSRANDGSGWSRQHSTVILANFRCAAAARI